MFGSKSAMMFSFAKKFDVGLSVVRQQKRLSSGAANTVSRVAAGNLTTVGVSKDTPSLVIFDKDGTLLCFHTMWIPWTKYTAESILNTTGLDVYQEIANVLGLCTIENKVKPGLLAEGTMSQITHEISEILQIKGIKSFEANEMAMQSLKYSNERTVECQLVKELSDTVSLFQRLKQHDTKIAICTADNRKNSLSSLKKMNVLDMVDIVVCGDDKTSLPKPHPHNALKICSHLAVLPSEAIMVGDTRVDMEMAHAAQLGAAVGVLSGVGCKDHLHKADVLINHVGHLVDTFYEA